MAGAIFHTGIRSSQAYSKRVSGHGKYSVIIITCREALSTCVPKRVDNYNITYYNEIQAETKEVNYRQLYKLNQKNSSMNSIPVISRRE